MPSSSPKSGSATAAAGATSTGSAGAGCDSGRRRALRLGGLGSLLIAAPLELAAKTGAEAPLGLVLLARGHQKSLARLMNAGPRMTRNMAGKMKSTVGKSILIGDFIARSSASA